jgi:hypothetical protein
MLQKKPPNQPSECEKDGQEENDAEEVEALMASGSLYTLL